MEELLVLERQLNAARQTKPAEPQPSDLKIYPHTTWSYLPVGAVIGDPNHTIDSHPHVDKVREKLRAAARDIESDPADREAAAKALKIMYRETV
jgi:hypothetical protein